jgi:ATP-dependent DNA helicase RecG
MERLQDVSVRYIKGIGLKRAKLFHKLGILTLEDLLYYFPRRYEDRSKFLSISQLKEGEFQTIKAQILAKGEKQSWRRRGFRITEVAVGDDTGKIFCVWFNQPYLKNYFKLGQSLILYGRIDTYSGRLQMNSPEFEVIISSVDESLNIGKITPIYALPEGLTQRSFRRLIKFVLNEYLSKINDFLPFDIRSRNNLLNLAKSLINIHFPENLEVKKQVYRRLSFEEFFLFQIPLALRKLKKQEKQGIAFNVTGGISEDFINNLPFKLTPAQEKVLGEIKLDMAKMLPMQRLLQGDVGSGKTVVATVACVIAIQNGYQVAFMVPTEILARQHYINIRSQLSNIKNAQTKISLGLLTSSLSGKEKEKIYKEIKEGKVGMVIGTHALLEEGIAFKRLGLVVIDEQHKFGVGQRALLPQKGINPDCLIMTATPIPRTLAITIYGDLDLSVITELPPGRLPITTLLISQDNIKEAQRIAREQVRLGHQVYIIYPVIEESYALDIAGAKKMYEHLKTNVFKEFKVGLIHGKLKQDEQDRIMLKFKNKDIDILVSTTVLEVGIDVPNATCMIIEYAQRFGLSQLHQLRGRIGRDKFESFCILVSDCPTQEAKMRQEAMVKYSDGFKIAEEDLKIRGPGEFFGLRQHGLTELKIANPLTQMQLLKKAREEAIRLVNLDPHLQERPNVLLKEKLLHRFPEYEKLVVVG